MRHRIAKRLATCLAVVGAMIGLLPMRAARADLLVQTDHHVISGKLISQNDSEVVFCPDGAAVPLHIARAAVFQVILINRQGAITADTATTLPSAPAGVPRLKIEPQTVDMIHLGDLSPATVPLADLTGTLPFTASDAQIQSLKKYVDRGGILFIDACGGGGFNDSIKDILSRAFPAAKSQALEAGAPLLSVTLDGMSDLSAMPLRAYAKSVGEKAAGFISFTSGKGRVIYSPMDITNGMLGMQTWGITGYTGPYCLDFMKSLVLWSAQGAPTTPQVSISRNFGAANGSGGVRPATGPAAVASGAVAGVPAAANFAGIAETKAVGGEGGEPFMNVSPSCQPIVGVRYAIGTSGGKIVVRSLEPLYSLPPELNAASSVVAKGGYVVGGLLVDADASGVRAVELVFVRYKDGRVNAAENYKSDWIGTPDDGMPLELAGNGETVIGIYGRQGTSLNSVGLVAMPAESGPR